MDRHILSSQIFIFETLREFGQFIDNAIQMHKSELTVYEEELGLMLRQMGQDNTEAEWAKEVQSKLTQGKETKVDKKKDKGKEKKDVKEKEKEREKKEKRKEGKIKSSANWKFYKDIQIFTGMTNEGKTEVYFAAVNEIKTTLEKLGRVKETLSQLASAGISDSFYLIYTKNGIPEKLVLIPQQKQGQSKFEFKADFVTENVEAPIESS